MRFRLEHGTRVYDLIPGRLTLGRSEDVQIPLDDPRVSRRHAELLIDNDIVRLRDLQSRNGVKVNGETVEGTRQLADGDRIQIGSQELRLSIATSQRPLERSPQTLRFGRLGIVAELALKAYVLGHYGEAERLLQPHLEQLLEDEEAGADVAEQWALLSAKLARATRKAAWADYPIALFFRRRKPLPAVVVDELHEALRVVSSVDLAKLNAYISLLAAQADEYSPAERFLLRRLRGLEELARSR